MNKKMIGLILLGTVVISSVSFGVYKSTIKEATHVKISLVSKGDVKDYISTTGTIKSNNTKDYYGPQGKVTKINVSVGDVVKKGDILIEFDIDSLSSSIAQAEIQYNNAILSKEMLQSNNEKINSKIAELNSEISKLDKEIAKLEASEDPVAQITLNELKVQRKSLVQSKDSITPISKEQLKQADNAIALAKSNLDTLKDASSKKSKVVKAEFDGVVTHIYTSVDAMSSGTQPVCTVQDIEDLKVTLSVGKYDSKLIKVGQEAKVSIDGEIIPGEVDFISPTATTILGEPVLIVDVILDGFNEYLKVDFSEDVDILVNEAKNVLRVPMEAIKYLNDGSTVVYKVEDDTAKEVKVEIGVESDSFVEIKKGLTLKDKVILNPSDSIVDGTLVSTEKSGV